MTKNANLTSTTPDGVTNVKGYCGKLSNGKAITYDGDNYRIVKSKNGETAMTYIGDETDGSKIKYPVGITNANCMYAGSDLTSPVSMPNGVTNASYMYANCSNLKHGDENVPDSVTSQSGMYDGDVNLVTSGNISKNCKDISYAYFGNQSLSDVSEVPDSVQNMEGMCAGSGVTTVPHIGSNVTNAKGAFANCDNLTAISDNLPDSSKTDIEDMFTDSNGIQSAVDTYVKDHPEATVSESASKKSLKEQLEDTTGMSMPFINAYMIHTQPDIVEQQSYDDSDHDGGSSNNTDELADMSASDDTSEDFDASVDKDVEASNTLSQADKIAQAEAAAPSEENASDQISFDK